MHEYPSRSKLDPGSQKHFPLAWYILLLTGQCVYGTWR